MTTRQQQLTAKDGYPRTPQEYRAVNTYFACLFGVMLLVVMIINWLSRRHLIRR